MARIGKIGALALAYLACAKAGFLVADEAGAVNSVWAPAGLAIGVLTTWGTWLWPGVLIGGLVAGATSDMSLAAAAVAAASNTAFAVVAATVLRRLDEFDLRLETVRSVVYLGAVACGAALISGTVGTAALWATGAIDAAELSQTWTLWWSGDVLGTMLLAPRIFAWRPPLPNPAAGRAPEAALAAVALAVALALAFTGPAGQEWVAFPVLMWIALRFRVAGAVLATLIAACVAGWLTARGIGPFAVSGDRPLLRAQAFGAATAFSAMLVAAAIRERSHAETKRQATEAARATLAEAQSLVGLATWEWFPGSGEVRLSPEMCRLTGLPPVVESPTAAPVLEGLHPDDRPKIARAAEELRAGSPVTYHFRVRARENEGYRLIQVAGRGDLDSQGRVVRVAGTGQDLTETVTSAADDHGQRWHAFEDAPTGIAIMAVEPGMEGQVLRANRAFAELLGRAQEDVVGLHFRDFTHPDDVEASRSAWAAMMGGSRTPQVFEKRHVRPDGTVVPVLVAASLVRDETGRPLYGITHIQDITARIQAERETEQQAESFRAAFETSLDAMVIADDDRRYVAVNAAAACLHGVPVDELLGMRMEDFAPEGFDVARAWKDLLASGEGRSETQLRRRDGTVIDVEASARANFLPGRHLSVLRDVTDRKRAEREVRRSEESLRRVLETTGEGVWMVGKDGLTKFMNARMGEIIGADVSTLIGRPSLELAHPDEVDFIRAQHAARARGERGEYEARLRRPDGGIVWVLLSATPMWDENGDYLGTMGMVNDITARVEADRRLERSEKRFRQIVETTLEGVWTTDRDGVTTFVNARMTEMLGWPPEDIVGRRFTDLCAEPAAALEAWRDVLSGTPVQREFVLLRADGTELNAWLSCSALPGVGGAFEGALAMVVDMSQVLKAQREAAELQEQLHQVQKLEIVGQLAGGVAHDFNNLLAVILNYAEFALRALPEDPVREDIEEIKHAAERAAALTQQLLVFSRRDMVESEALDLNELLVDLIRLTRRTLGADIDLRVEPGEDVPPVQAERTRVEQVLMNLAVNARDAMPGGGRLAISTRACTDREGRWVRLTVEDSGEGMTDEVRTRAFEPFFTTKPQGAGTGLGLATVYGIVTSWGGRVGIESEPGSGTVVTVDLPAADVSRAAARNLPDGPSRTETILVVEDEPAVRRMTVRILSNAGFRVLEAGRPSEALDVFSGHEGSIDLVLTDIVMPERPGTALAEELVRARPATRVMFMSGYADKANRLPDGAPFIPKPFGAEALIEQVEATLTAKDTA